MPRIRPARWVAGHAASGLRDLPRNGAWLVSKVLRSSVAATESAAHDTSDGLRRVTIAVADVSRRARFGGDQAQAGRRRRSPGRKRPEQQALAEAQTASEQADAAKAVSEDAKRRVREATREGKQEVQRRTQAGTEPSRLIDQSARRQTKRSRNGSSGSPLT